MKHKFSIFTSFLALLLAAVLVSGCGGGGNAGNTEQGSTASEAVSGNTSETKTEAVSETASESKSEAAETAAASETAHSSAPESESDIPTETIVAPDEAPVIEGLTFVEKTPLKYAKCFAVFRYEGGYSLVDIPTVGQFLVVPEGKEAPEGLAEDIVVLQQPVNTIYMAATSSMALVAAIDGIDSIRLSSLQASGWYVQEAIDAMNDGRMLFSGKYSEPDYEMMIDENCCLAIESRMIYHTPKVMEMIQDLGIPVLVDISSNEDNPLGRTEWVKMYGALIGKEAEAEAFFENQANMVEELQEFENTGKTIAFFNINADGSAVIRTPTDYVPKMIDMAGGVYMFADYDTNVTSSTIHISMEEFYAKAIDADYIVYNGSIVQPLTSVQDLLALDPLFADFKAVKEGNVYTVGRDFYQATDDTGTMIREFYELVTGGDMSQAKYITHVE